MKHIVLFLLIIAACPAWAEKTVAVTPTDIDQVRDLEEVIVTGNRKLSEARRAIEEAEDRFYNRWNQTNGDRRFDIHCHDYVRTGTLLGVRACEPRFVTDIQTAAAQETMSAMQGAMSANGGTVLIRDGSPQVQLETQEMKKRMLLMVNSDPELKRALLERARLEQFYEELRKDRFKGRLIIWD